MLDAEKCHPETEFGLLIEQITDYAFFMLDAQGYVSNWNRGAERLKGYSAKEIIGRHFSIFYTPEDRAMHKPERALATATAAGTYEDEGWRVRKDGTRFWAAVTITALRDKDGKLRGFAKLTRDMSERKRMEDALRRSEAQFRLLYENAPIGIARFDPRGSLMFANKKFSEIIGYSADQILHLDYIDLTPPEERETSRDSYGRLMSGEIDLIDRERRVLRQDGSTIWVRVTATLMRDEAGQPEYGIGVFEDITERKRTEEALRQTEEKLRATFAYAPVGISESRPDGTIVHVNPKLLSMLGYTVDEFSALSIKQITHPADLEQTLAKHNDLLAGKTASYSIEKRLIRKDRTFMWADVSVALRRDPHTGEPESVISIIEDITSRKRAEEDLKRALEQSHYLASHDALTGLATRTEFTDRQRDALAYAKRDEHLVAIHFLDLDRFKSINDSMGHHVGDLLLKEVAKRIKSHTRATDLAARLGGDEFGVIQTHLTETDAAAVFAEKLVEELHRPYLLDGLEVHSGTSIGIAFYPKDGQTPEQLSELADLALYEAKNRGRCNYQFYSQEMGAIARKARELEADLVRALEDNQFCLHYQPQFDLRSGRITAIEALLRWRHPQRGLLAAADFIPEAEDSGLMLAIEEWALRAACRQHKAWLQAGLAVPLTVNASSKQLRHPRFLKILKQVLAEAEFEPSMLQLEIQEGVLMDAKIYKNALNGLKETGVRLSLDDFGTDVIAFSCLRNFPLDVVKLGHALVKKLPAQEAEAAIASAIIDVAHCLKITVCAEGVETAEQLPFLAKHGCLVGQGHLLGGPCGPEETSRLVEKDLLAFSQKKAPMRELKTR